MASVAALTRRLGLMAVRAPPASMASTVVARSVSTLMSYSFPPPQSPLALGQAPSSATRTPSSRSPLGTRAAPAARFLSKKSGRKVDSVSAF